MSKIEIGEYVRTTDGYIGKLIEINKKNWNYLTVDCKNQLRTNDIYPRNYLYLKEEYITKHSKNIIDLIEAGDFVNGYKVISVDYDVLDNTTECIELDLNNAFQYQFISINQIKEILTKQQYNANKFIVESEC